MKWSLTKNQSGTSRWPTYPTLEKPKEDQNQLSSSERVFQRYPFNCSLESSALHIYNPQPCMKAWWMRCEELAQKCQTIGSKGVAVHESYTQHLSFYNFLEHHGKALHNSNEHNATQSSTEKYKCPIQNHSLNIFCSLYPSYNNQVQLVHLCF
jgi:hypothetical protein